MKGKEERVKREEMEQGLQPGNIMETLFIMGNYTRKVNGVMSGGARIPDSVDEVY